MHFDLYSFPNHSSANQVALYIMNINEFTPPPTLWRGYLLSACIYGKTLYIRAFPTVVLPPVRYACNMEKDVIDKINMETQLNIQKV